jgi:hypothetical protein
MTLIALGDVSLSDAVPGCATACVEGTAGINGALPDITARIGALAAFTPTADVDFGAQKAVSIQTTAALVAAIEGGLPAPTMQVQADMADALKVQLEAQVNAVNGSLELIADVSAALGVEGELAAYAYDGPVGTLAAELAVELGADAAHCNALVLVVRDPAVWAALSQIMKVSP